jgi:hypothetical protein
MEFRSTEGGSECGRALWDGMLAKRLADPMAKVELSCPAHYLYAIVTCAAPISVPPISARRTCANLTCANLNSVDLADATCPHRPGRVLARLVRPGGALCQRHRSGGIRSSSGMKRDLGKISRMAASAPQIFSRMSFKGAGGCPPPSHRERGTASRAIPRSRAARCAVEAARRVELGERRH